MGGAAIHDVVEGVGIFDTKWSGHGISLVGKRHVVKERFDPLCSKTGELQTDTLFYKINFCQSSTWSGGRDPVCAFVFVDKSF